MVKLNAGFVGTSRAQQELLEDAAIVAPRDTTVLVTGESGTGKELLAQYLHRHSSRREAPFITCDCAAISSSLCESELFGYRRGAFTGALRDAPGYMAASDSGTLFLDEIGELNLESQTRLLRFLEERTVVPVGDVTPRRLDVRVVAATNQDLEGLVGGGRFREDLFFRLNVINLHLPPLRQRREDVEPLAEYFRRHFALEHRKTVVGFTPQAKELLFSWEWPGNVRELRNAVERAVVMCRGTWIDCADLPARVLRAESSPAPRPAPAAAPAEESAQATSFADRTMMFQRRLLEDTLAEVNGSRREAARRLQLSAHQLKYLVAKLDLSPQR